jgi:glutaminyl-peptide cyclotransferase
LLSRGVVTGLRPLWLFVGVLAAAVSGIAQPPPACSAGSVRIVHILPHDPTAFTQGLLYHHGFFYESTGLKGRSSVRKVVPETGEVVQRFDLPGQYFGEGLARWGDRLVQLTWQSRVGFIYDLQTFKPLRTFSYATEGWGLTQDGSSLIMSDGSAVLRFLDPETYEVTRAVEVRDGGVPVALLNELEYVGDQLFANVWQKDIVLRISPSDGNVLGMLDLSHLRSALGPVRGAEVLNGIAYDRENHRIFVTGKLWPKVFEIEVPDLEK